MKGIIVIYIWFFFPAIYILFFFFFHLFSKGYVTLTDPVNACTKVAPPPHVSMSTYGWIALIPRTNTADKCDFDLKVKINSYFALKTILSFRC